MNTTLIIVLNLLFGLMCFSFGVYYADKIKGYLMRRAAKKMMKWMMKESGGDPEKLVMDAVRGGMFKVPDDGFGGTLEIKGMIRPPVMMGEVVNPGATVKRREGKE
jgi:hypothetical protein